jgi:hypothetical protein
MWGDEIESGGVWKPTKIGDKLEGVLRERTVLPGRNDKDYTLFTIETEEGDVKISGAVLESKLAEVADGSKILVTYKGKPKGTYLDYAVQVWREE